MTKRVIFRCDAGDAPEIGTGHIVRSKNIARTLIAEGLLDTSDILFLTRGDPDFCLGEQYLSGSGLRYEVLSDFQLEPNSLSEISVLRKYDPDLVIIDRLSTSQKLIKALSRSGAKTTTFDDYGSGRIYADLAISAIFNDVEDSANLVKGYEYLVLSQEKYYPKPIQENVSNIVATFGGYDARDLSAFFIQSFCQYGFSCPVKIVIGKTSSQKISSYRDLISRCNLEGSVELLICPIDYHAIISNADIGITSGGLSIFEFAAYGIPTIGLPQYEHQLRTIRNLSEEKICIVGSHGMTLSAERLRNSFSSLINDRGGREAMAIKARGLIDGGGLNRIINLLIEKFPETLHA